MAPEYVGVRTLSDALERPIFLLAHPLLVVSVEHLDSEVRLGQALLLLLFHRIEGGLRRPLIFLNEVDLAGDALSDLSQDREGGALGPGLGG